VWPAVAGRFGQTAPGGSQLGALPSALSVAAVSANLDGCVMLIAAHTYNPFIYFRF